MIRDEMARELREIKQELEDRVWKGERSQRDVERLTKEKERAYEKVYEAQQEHEEKRLQERKVFDARWDVLTEEMAMYKQRLKEADKLLAKMKVRNEERDVAHREETLALKVSVDELSAANKQYRDRLDAINLELLAIDIPEEIDGA